MPLASGFAADHVGRRLWSYLQGLCAGHRQGRAQSPRPRGTFWSCDARELDALISRCALRDGLAALGLWTEHKAAAGDLGSNDPHVVGFAGLRPRVQPGAIGVLDL